MPVAAVSAPVAAKPPMRIRAGVVETMGPTTIACTPFRAPSAAPGVVPKADKLALDSAMNATFGYAGSDAFSEGLSFMGYPYLAELTQRAEYRRPSEILAKEMTRKWIRLQATGDEDKADKLREIEAEFKRLGVQDAFRRAAEQDGFFGRSQIYIDTGAGDQPQELRLPLSVSKAKIAKGSLRGLIVIEPIWTYPNTYNSTNPLRDDFFKPSIWVVMSQQIHASRLLTFVSRDVPDLLKPAYAFGGLSLSQIAKPYVDNWLRTRQSVSDALHAFSVMVLKTNMAGVLNAGSAADMTLRAQLFNQTRDNRGLMMVDKDTEDLENVTMPLGGLDKLQAQAQEQMAAVTGIPLVVLLGITPSGLNASSEGELQSFYAWIESQQSTLFGPPLSKLLAIVQLSLYGEIDPEIGFVFEPLRVMSEKEIAEVRKTEAETDAALITAGIVDPTEARARLAAQEDSAYASLDLDKVIEAPAQGGEGGAPGGDPFGGGDDPSGGGPAPTDGDAPADPAPIDQQQLAGDADQARADNGQFGTGGAAITLKAKKRVREFGEPAHTRVDLSDGTSHRMVRLNSQESMGLPGWHHDSEAIGGSTYLADTETEAINALIGRHAAKTRQAHDAWVEADHSRSDNGQFGNGGAAGSSAKRTDAKMGEALRSKISGNFDAAVSEYSKLPESGGGKIINTDTARELSADYLADRTKSAAVHEPASQFCKDLYAKKLTEAPGPGELPLVLFTAGGTGAGKSTAITGTPGVAEINAKAQIVYDTNMNGFESSKSKIDQALAAGKTVAIAMVVRDPEDALVNGALPRAERQRKEFGSGRTVPVEEHIKTHVGSISTVKRIAEEYKGNPNVHVRIIDNSLGKGKQQERDIAWLHSQEYNDVEQRVRAALEREHESGRISDETYRGFAEGGAKAHAQPGSPSADRRVHSQDRPGDGGSPAQGNDGRAGEEVVDETARRDGAGGSHPPKKTDDLALDDEHWITTEGGSHLLISGGGVVLGGAGGNMNGQTLSPKSKSAPRASNGAVTEKNKAIASALQNRNRNSAASIAQMNRIATNPNPRLLMSAPTMNDGAPVVTDLAGSGVAKHTGKRDWIVTGKREIPIRYAVVEADQLSISNRADGTKNADYANQPDKMTAINNGRTAGVVAAYERGTADAYKTAIAKAEKVHGIPAKTIRGMKAPVLVRIMDAASVDEHIGDESNSTQTLTLSAVEQAANDSTRFDPTAIDYKDDGSPTDESVKGFINAMPASERQSLSPNGRPTKQAIDRMMAATFHTAYGDSELVGLMAQATDPESRNLINGMSRAAGSMAKLKDAGDLDIRELVTGAAKQIINAVRSGVSIKKYLAQGDLLTSTPESQIAALFAENARSSRVIGEKLDAAAKFAYAESQRGGTDMFGETIPTASRNNVLETLHA